MSPLVEAGVRLFADHPTWVSKYGHKGIMHPHISKQDQSQPVVETMNLNVKVSCAEAQGS